MIRRFSYRELGVHSPSTAGAAMDLDTFPAPIRDSYNVIEAICWMGSPLPLLAATNEEGIDSPFFTRDLLAREMQIAPFRRVRLGQISKAVQSTHGLGTPLPILAIPPDDTCVLPIARLTDGPYAQFMARRRKYQYLAATTTKENPGYWGERIPATTYTTNSCALLEEIQRHMLESTIDGGTTWSIWTQAEVLGYLNERLAKFMVETGLIRERFTDTTASNIVDLPTDLIEIRRVAWNGSSLTRVDDWMVDNTGLSGTTGTPYAYIEEPQLPLQIQLIPGPSVAGTVDIFYVQTPPTIGSVCTNLPLPNMLVPYIKYGVMADMFTKQGEANDPERAEYCELRFLEGITLGRLLAGSAK